MLESRLDDRSLVGLHKRIVCDSMGFMHPG
jgi:hypothetical protein